MRDTLETVLTIVGVLVFIGIKFFGKSTDEGGGLPTGDLPSTLPDETEDATPYTPLPEAMIKRAKNLPPLTSPERARHELQKTLRRQKQFAQRSEAQPTVVRVPDPAIFRNMPTAPMERVMQRNRAIQIERATAEAERGEEEKAKKADAARRALQARAAGAPATPILEEEAVGVCLHAEDVRDMMDDQAQLRRLFVLRELLDPPLSLRRNDPFLTFPYER